MVFSPPLLTLLLIYSIIFSTLIYANPCFRPSEARQEFRNHEKTTRKNHISPPRHGLRPAGNGGDPVLPRAVAAPLSDCKRLSCGRRRLRDRDQDRDPLQPHGEVFRGRPRNDSGAGLPRALPSRSPRLGSRRRCGNHSRLGDRRSPDLLHLGRTLLSPCPVCALPGRPQRLPAGRACLRIGGHPPGHGASDLAHLPRLDLSAPLLLRADLQSNRPRPGENSLRWKAESSRRQASKPPSEKYRSVRRLRRC